jgi:hypothetical protein
MNNPKPQPQQINVKIDEKVGEGIYANFLMVANNQSEYVLDFGRIVPGMKDVRIFSRIMATPQHAKQFYTTLKQNIDQYEKQFGEIKIVQNQIVEPKNIGFQNSNKNEEDK